MKENSPGLERTEVHVVRAKCTVKTGLQDRSGEGHQIHQGEGGRGRVVAKDIKKRTD